MREPTSEAPKVYRSRLLARLGRSPGLCATCRHLELIETKRSAFVRCALAREDPLFARYPVLPVLACAGYVRALDAGDSSG